MDPEANTRLASSWREQHIQRQRSKWPEQCVLVCEWGGVVWVGLGVKLPGGLRLACAGPFPACFNWKVEPEEENQEKRDALLL